MKYSNISYIRGTPYLMSDVRLRVEINNKNPIDLLYLTNSFISLSDEYKRHLSAHNIKYNAESAVMKLIKNDKA